MFRFLFLMGKLTIKGAKGFLFGKITAEKDQKLRLAQIFTNHCDANAFGYRLPAYTHLGKGCKKLQ